MSDLMIHVRFIFDYVSISTCFYSSNVKNDLLADELDFDDEVIADEAARNICDQMAGTERAYDELRDMLLLHANEMIVELP